MKEIKNVSELHKVSKGLFGVTFGLFLIGGFVPDANAATVTVTQTVDNVKWQLILDTFERTAQLGVGTAASGKEAACMAVLDGMPSCLQVPSKFTIEGRNYTVNSVASRAFPRDRAGKLYNVIFPLDVDTTIGKNVFVLSSISNILFRGSQSSQGEPSCSTLTLPDLETPEYSQSIVRGCTKIKSIVVGPNVRVDSPDKLDNLFNVATNAVLVVPRNEGNMSWNGSHEVSLGGENNSVVYYGPSEAFDMEMYDTYATFIPNTEEGLTQVLGLAQTFKTAFNFDVRIAIKKRINMTAEVIESMLQSVTLVGAPPWYITFAVRTQAQLDYVLSVVQVDIPVIIDMDGATEDIVVPEGRQVAILAKGGWTFGKKHKGLVIHFK